MTFRKDVLPILITNINTSNPYLQEKKSAVKTKMSVSPKDSNGEIFLANSQGWKEEAEAVIKDVKDQVKEIVISNKLEVSSSTKQLLVRCPK